VLDGEGAIPPNQTEEIDTHWIRERT